MVISSPIFSQWHCTLAAALLAIVTSSARGSEVDDYQYEAKARCQQAEIAWRNAGCPGEFSAAGDELVQAAIHDGRPDLVEQVLAGGSLLKRMLPIPRGSQHIMLHTLHTFRTFRAELADEMFASINHRPDGWLARRITNNAIEVWTSKHGWLFDGRGHLRHEAEPQRRAGWGREWYGAFLPNGRWITTDIDVMDGKLLFYSADGKWQRALTCEQLAPPPPETHSKLIGWARSDGLGTGWVVNVGSEEGWATVWVAPDGPARVLKPGERWDLCYRRALGPRGTYWHCTVPDDGRHGKLERVEAGHGPAVGFPDYYSGTIEDHGWIVPNGNFVFGYWPGRTSFFVGANTFYQEGDQPDPSGMLTLSYNEDALEHPIPIIDKTWFFDSGNKVRGWVRARRIGDAANGHDMLFRITADSRIVTLGPDLKVKAVRRFVWKDGNTADAVILWDDLHLGLFVRDRHLVLAKWPG